MKNNQYLKQYQKFLNKKKKNKKNRKIDIVKQNRILLVHRINYIIQKIITYKVNYLLKLEFQ